MQEKEKKRSQKKEPLPFSDRLGFSPTEFAGMFGKQAVWGYRQIYDGKVKAIQTLGRLIVPKSEIDRLLATAAPYNGDTNAEPPQTVISGNLQDQHGDETST
jgi:hypothetical protein